MAPLAATATGSTGETIEANVVSSSLRLAVSTEDINGLAADATFGDNLKSSIATTLNVDPSTVAIKSVNVVNGKLQVEYDVVFSDASAASATAQSLNEAATGTSSGLANSVATNLQGAV